MSADNWANCPQCIAMADEAIEKLEEKARKAYGKVTAEKYEEMASHARAEREKFESKGIEQTFREDYHQGINDDFSYSISYSGRCTKCNLAFEFKHEVPDIRKKASA